MLPYTACPQSTPILLPLGTVEGRLPNGLHYLILHNASPASRVEFRLIMRVPYKKQSKRKVVPTSSNTSLSAVPAIFLNAL